MINFNYVSPSFAIDDDFKMQQQATIKILGHADQITAKVIKAGKKIIDK